MSETKRTVWVNAETLEFTFTGWKSRTAAYLGFFSDQLDGELVGSTQLDNKRRVGFGRVMQFTPGSMEVSMGPGDFDVAAMLRTGLFYIGLLDDQGLEMPMQRLKSDLVRWKRAD